MNYDDELISFEVKGDTVIAIIDGEIDHHRAKGLREAIDARIYTDRPACFMADMSGVTFMDSSGVGLVMGRYRLVRMTGGTLLVCGASERIRQMMRMAGLDSLDIWGKEEQKHAR